MIMDFSKRLVLISPRKKTPINNIMFTKASVHETVLIGWDSKETLSKWSWEASTVWNTADLNKKNPLNIMNLPGRPMAKKSHRRAKFLLVADFYRKMPLICQMHSKDYTHLARFGSDRLGSTQTTWCIYLNHWLRPPLYTYFVTLYQGSLIALCTHSRHNVCSICTPECLVLCYAAPGRSKCTKWVFLTVQTIAP